MPSEEVDVAWIARLLPTVVALVAATLATSWIVWFLFARVFGGLPVAGPIRYWGDMAGFLAVTVRWSGLLVTLGYVVGRATD